MGNANNKHDLASRQIRSVTYLGMVVNIALSVVKVVIGLTVSSLAMLADGIHSPTRTGTADSRPFPPS